MSPKNLLRHKDCKSELSEFDDMHQTHFKRLLEDQSFLSDCKKGVRRLILCSGKVVTLSLYQQEALKQIFSFKNAVTKILKPLMPLLIVQ